MSYTITGITAGVVGHFKILCFICKKESEYYMKNLATKNNSDAIYENFPGCQCRFQEECDFFDMLYVLLYPDYHTRIIMKGLDRSLVRGKGNVIQKTRFQVIYTIEDDWTPDTEYLCGFGWCCNKLRKFLLDELGGNFHKRCTKFEIYHQPFLTYNLENSKEFDGTVHNKNSTIFLTVRSEKDVPEEYQYVKYENNLEEEYLNLKKKISLYGNYYRWYLSKK